MKEKQDEKQEIHPITLAWIVGAVGFLLLNIISLFTKKIMLAGMIFVILEIVFLCFLYYKTVRKNGGKRC